MIQGLCLKLGLLAAVWIGVTESLKCYSCSNIDFVSDCLTLARCANDEECYTETTGVGNNTVYTLGCRTLEQCRGSATQSPVSIVGRKLQSWSTPTSCSLCCAVDSCNEHLCNHASHLITSTDGQCKDDPDYNCQLFAGTFNICEDVHHAKTVCRKYCGLCNLVDGSWSAWSTWTSCSTSCGQGHMSRDRTCTEPIPSHGGLDCMGIHVNVSNCTVAVCPIHGGWSAWTSWGECSVTCGVGLQRRGRNCSNPFPGPDGNPCFEDARDDRVCFFKACADGGWSAWSSWDSCSATCDGGLKSRHRSCDNPTPSTFGKLCDGNNEDKMLCNTHSCPAEAVIFSVHTPSSQLVGGSTTGIPIFTHILTNIGNCYNVTSGEFKCTVPGTYHFSVSFTIIRSGNSYCAIRHNDINFALAQTHYSSSDFYLSATASAYITLAVSDNVDLYCNGWESVSKGMYSSFNGALIAPS